MSIDTYGATGKSDSGNNNKVKQHANHPRHGGTSWIDVAWLMLSDIVGTSVLTFGAVAKSLGAFPTVIFIVGLFPMSLYVSTLMAKTRSLVVQTAELQRRPVPSVETMGEVARHAFCSRGAGSAVSFMVYGFTLLGQASYLLVLGTSMQDVLYSMPVCIYEAIAIGCFSLLLPGLFVRKLGESVILCFVNLLIIVVVVAITLGSVVQQGKPAGTQFPAVASDLTLMTAMGAATNVVYSYAGQWMYFEIMDTMEQPSDFPRAFAVTGPIMVVIYLVVALVALAYGATTGDILQSMPRGPWLRVAAILLFAHVLIVYLVKSVVLQRYMHRSLSPGDFTERTTTSYLKHGGLGAAMLAFGFLVANAVPFFSQLLGLIGGFLGGPINFLFPIFLYLTALGRFRQASREAERGAVDREEQRAEDCGGCDASWETPSVLMAYRALPPIASLEFHYIVFIFVFIGATMVLGVSQVINEIIDLNGKFGMPFSCHALPPPGSVALAALSSNATASKL